MTTFTMRVGYREEIDPANLQPIAGCGQWTSTPDGQTMWRADASHEWEPMTPDEAAEQDKIEQELAGQYQLGDLIPA